MGGEEKLVSEGETFNYLEEEEEEGRRSRARAQTFLSQKIFSPLVQWRHWKNKRRGLPRARSHRWTYGGGGGNHEDNVC